MTVKRRPGIPPVVLVLDLVGTTLLAVGLYARYGGGHHPVWQLLASDAASALFIVVGATCMLPLLFVVRARVQRAGGAAGSRPGRSDSTN